MKLNELDERGGRLCFVGLKIIHNAFKRYCLCFACMAYVNFSQLMYIMNIAERKGVNCGYTVDAGLTEVLPGTKTVGFVGPDFEVKVDKLTGQLKLY